MNEIPSVNSPDAPVFIGGLMKSGTSLMRVLLSQHPDVFGGFETHWFSTEFQEDWSNRESRRMRFLLDFFDLSPADHQAFCKLKTAEPQRQFVDIVLDFCTARAGKKRWVEKTPANISHWNEIRESWPNARLIHVTREYRDCFASWKDRRKDSLENFLAAVSSAYSQIGGLMGGRTRQYLEVDYSELVCNPEETMRNVLDFCDLPWSDDCIQLDIETQKQDREKVKTVIGRDSHTNISLSKPIFTNQINQWRQILTAEEAGEIRNKLDAYYQIYGKKWSL